MSLEESFRKLRRKWFYAKIYRNAHEREWESQEAEDNREDLNSSLRFKFDADTEAIIRGEDRVIGPECEADLGE